MHENCPITFLTKIIQFVKRYGYKSQSHDASEEEILGGDEDISNKIYFKKVSWKIMFHML